MTGTPTHRELGLAQLSSLRTPPPEFVSLAASAGFDFVGLRVRPVTPSETPFDLQPASPLLAETLARVADTGVGVRDVEFLLLDGSDQRDAWRRMLEAGHALGARSLTVAVADTDRARVVDNLARMVADASGTGVLPAVEPISYQALRSLPDASELAQQTGVGVVVDTLHVARFAGTDEELETIAPRVPMLQLCDAPEQRPSDREGLVAESRSRRLPAGEGDTDLAGMLRALERGRAATTVVGGSAPPLPVSLEIPDDERSARLGAQAWIRHLHETATRWLETNKL